MGDMELMRLRRRPGDALVAKFAGHPSTQQIRLLVQEVKDHLGMKVLIAEGGMDYQILRREPRQPVTQLGRARIRHAH